MRVEYLFQLYRNMYSNDNTEVYLNNILNKNEIMNLNSP